MEKVFCTIPGKDKYWIQLKERISIKEWNDWRSANYDKTQEMIPNFILNWNLEDENGNQIEIKNFLDADIVFLNWMINAITDCVIERMKLPEKNSSGSQSAQTNKA